MIDGDRVLKRSCSERCNDQELLGWKWSGRDGRQNHADGAIESGDALG